MNFLEGAAFFASSSFFQPCVFCQCVSFFEEVLNTKKHKK